MKTTILIILFSAIAFSQQDGSLGHSFNINSQNKNDYTGKGIAERVSIPDLIKEKNYKFEEPPSTSLNPDDYNFSQMWSSPSGAFSNSWDGIAGYFDNDTLLCIAGYTFGPNMFYIWEQSPTQPDSFALVF